MHTCTPHACARPVQDVEEQLFADKERKADLEATKAALRHQVAAERSRGF